MTDSWKPPGPSAFDDMTWPEHLLARAIEPDPVDDRLHGYAVLGDLARHRSFSDLLFLAVVGELPDPRSAALFALSLCTFATPSVAEAPTHAAVLTRLAGAPVSSALGAGLVAAADQARHLLVQHASLLVWLETPTETVPASGTQDPAWMETLITAVKKIDPDANHLQLDMSRDAGRIALMYMAGIRAADQMVAVMVAARVCGIAAEALATGPQHLGQYPVTLPPFRYVETK
jgi:hypothetical protein